LSVHELSIVQALLERVDREAAARGAIGVHGLHVRVGALSGVDVPLLLTAYAAFRERSLCEHAELHVTEVAADWRCPRCDGAIARGAVLTCPTCQAPARLAGGDEIILDRIEMEVRDV
jgi:hydrogenase nickel incorporation protein HypA/HybF